jgi:hypothetical protein
MKGKITKIFAGIGEYGPYAYITITPEAGDVIEISVGKEAFADESDKTSCMYRLDQWIEWESIGKKKNGKPKLEGMRNSRAPGAPFSQEIPGVDTLKETKPIPKTPDPTAEPTFIKENLWDIDHGKLETYIRKEMNPVIKGHMENILAAREHVSATDINTTACQHLEANIRELRETLVVLIEMIKQWKEMLKQGGQKP